MQNLHAESGKAGGRFLKQAGFQYLAWGHFDNKAAAEILHSEDGVINQSILLPEGDKTLRTVQYIKRVAFRTLISSYVK